MSPERAEIRERAAAHQRRAADPAASSWVSANAGSGKTRVLTDRVARLLLAGADPSAILCITYTKAAANEMSKRLFDQLGAWSMASDEALIGALEALGEVLPRARLGEARRLFARALEAPGGLKIETVHAFCQRILQRFPVEAGVVPEFEVIDERAAAGLLDEARKEMFLSLAQSAEEEAGAATAALLDDQGEANFNAILEDGIKHRTKIETFLAASRDAAARVRAFFLLAPQETFAAVEAACHDDPHCDAAGLRRLCARLAQGSPSDKERGAAILSYLNSSARAAYFEALYSAFVTDSATPRKTVATKPVLQRDPTLADIIEKEALRLMAWEQKRRRARTADLSIAALTILADLFGRYAAAKEARAALDYDDLILRTLALLQNHANAWVHFKLDGGISHVLIDEAQDTSPDQWDIVRLLTGEFFALEAEREASARTIFAVGDEKQSIYSFQGAEPARFEAMRGFFERAVTASRRRWSPQELEVSFRSVETVLRVVDAAFAGNAASPVLTAQPLELRHIAERIGEDGLVELWPAPEKPRHDDSEYEDWTRPVDQLRLAPERRLADKIAAQIRIWVDQGAPLAMGARAIEPGDVLILVRQRAALFYEMQRALARAGLPVAGSDRMVLREEAAFLDLDALGRFCLLPQDDLALAEVLKGPFVGLKDEDLMALAPGRKGSLWAALQAEPRYKAARDWLAGAILRARTMRPFEFYLRALDGDAGDPDLRRRNFAERLGPDAQDVIGEFLALALAYEREGPASLQGFLAYVGERADIVKRDMEEAQGRVRVMTVHGAKGLEAPIVFLIDTCSAPKASRDKWLFGDAPVLCRPSKERDDICKRLAEEEARRQHGEYQRQLYVAMTRARDRLYIAGVRARSGYGGSWHAFLSSTLEAAPDAMRIETEEGPLLRFGAVPQGAAAQASKRVAPPPRPAWIGRAPVHERGALRRTPSALLPEESEAQPAVFAPAESAPDPFLRGAAIHKLLQLLPAILPEKREAAARRLLALAPYRALAAQGDEIVAETLHLLSGAYAPLFGSGSRAEVPIAGTLKLASGRPLLISGQIDRLLVTEAAIHIVDFKTNRSPPQSAGNVPKVYLHQMAAYQRLLEEALPGRAVKAFLLYTAAPRLIALDLAGIDVTGITEDPWPAGPAPGLLDPAQGGS